MNTWGVLFLLECVLFLGVLQVFDFPLATGGLGDRPPSTKMMYPKRVSILFDRVTIFCVPQTWVKYRGHREPEAGQHLIPCLLCTTRLTMTTFGLSLNGVNSPEMGAFHRCSFTTARSACQTRGFLGSMSICRRVRQRKQNEQAQASTHT